MSTDEHAAALCPLRKLAINTMRKLPLNWLNGVMTTGIEVSRPGSSIAVNKSVVFSDHSMEKTGFKHDHTISLLL